MASQDRNKDLRLQKIKPTARYANIYPHFLSPARWPLTFPLFLFCFPQMVATDEQTSERQQHAADSGGGASQTGALNKMKATISSSLLTVTDKGKHDCSCGCVDLGVCAVILAVSAYEFMAWIFIQVPVKLLAKLWANFVCVSARARKSQQWAFGG